MQLFSLLSDLFELFFERQKSPVLGIFWITRVLAVVCTFILAFFNPKIGFFLSLILALVSWGISAFLIHLIRDGEYSNGAPFIKRLIFTICAIILSLAFVYYCWGPDFTFYYGIIFNPATYAIAYFFTSITTYLIAMITPKSLYYRF